MMVSNTHKFKGSLSGILRLKKNIRKFAFANTQPPVHIVKLFSRSQLEPENLKWWNLNSGQAMDPVSYSDLRLSSVVFLDIVLRSNQHILIQDGSHFVGYGMVRLFGFGIAFKYQTI